MHDHPAGTTTPDAQPRGPSLNQLAAQATTHCLTGCAIGEVLGLVVSTELGWGNEASIAISIVLAYVFGFTLTIRPLLASGLAFAAALGIALAADGLSITVMEIVDNATVLLVPGAMNAGLTDALFWASLAASLVLAWFAAYPVNRWLIARGQGHARVMAHHEH
jgi:hypothetical protein